MARIVVADDNSLHLDMVVTALERAGHMTMGMLSGEKCRTAISAGACDLVVLDIGLSGADGVPVVDWLRQRGDGIPVVGMSASWLGYGSLDRSVRPVTILQKPFTPAELQAAVDEALAVNQEENNGIAA